MRRILIGLVLALVALPAWSQTQQQHDWCYSPTATDDQTIEGCTALVQSGRYTGTNLSTVLNSRSVGYQGKGQWDLAIQDETQAIQLDPTNAQAFNNRCADKYHKRLYDDAIPDCNQTIALKPDYAHAYYNRGLVYEDKGQRDQAITDYRAALKLNPNDKDSQAGLKRLGVTQ